MSESITYDALETNKQDLFVVTEKRKRGRPPKSFLTQNNSNDDIEIKPVVTANNAAFLERYPQIPKDNFGKWKTFHVSETSEVFTTWLDHCQEIVDDEFGPYIWDLKVKKYNKYIWVVMENDKRYQRPFAFIDKATANIHCPATYDDPFEHYNGNICDPGTMYSVIGPYGVKTEWAFLPTHPNNVPVK